jgi:hypothetical protein
MTSILTHRNDIFRAESLEKSLILLERTKSSKNYKHAAQQRALCACGTPTSLIGNIGASQAHFLLPDERWRFTDNNYSPLKTGGKNETDV